MYYFNCTFSVEKILKSLFSFLLSYIVESFEYSIQVTKAKKKQIKEFKINFIGGKCHPLTSPSASPWPTLPSFTYLALNASYNFIVSDHQFSLANRLATFSSPATPNSCTVPHKSMCTMYMGA